MGVRELGNGLGNPLGLPKVSRSGFRDLLQFIFSPAALPVIQRSSIPYRKFIVLSLQQGPYQGGSYTYAGITAFNSDGSFQLGCNTPVPASEVCLSILGLPDNATVTTFSKILPDTDRVSTDFQLPSPVNMNNAVISAFIGSPSVPTSYMYGYTFAELVNGNTVRVHHGSNSSSLGQNIPIYIQVAVVPG